jgi:hypothetical protein
VTSSQAKRSQVEPDRINAIVRWVQIRWQDKGELNRVKIVRINHQDTNSKVKFEVKTVSTARSYDMITVTVTVTVTVTAYRYPLRVTIYRWGPKLNPIRSRMMPMARIARRSIIGSHHGRGRVSRRVASRRVASRRVGAFGRSDVRSADDGSDDGSDAVADTSIWRSRVGGRGGRRNNMNNIHWSTNQCRCFDNAMYDIVN